MSQRYSAPSVLGAVLVLLTSAACGSSHNNRPVPGDAGQPDAAIPVPDAGNPPLPQPRPNMDAGVDAGPIDPVPPPDSGPGHDAWVTLPDAGHDSGSHAVLTCCADAACTKPAKDACPDGLLCMLGSDGKPESCGDTCAATQVCGSLCCPYGAACDAGECRFADLAVDLNPASFATTRADKVLAEDCRAIDGCMTEGTHTLLEATVVVKNVGKLNFSLPDLEHQTMMTPSFCQDSFLVRDFVLVQIRNSKGEEVRNSLLPTLCSKDGAENYACAISTLQPGKTAVMPEGACNEVDVSKLVAGTYTIEVTINPGRVFAEKSFDNNKISWTFEHTGCDGVQCGGVCCAPGVACFEDKCVEGSEDMDMDMDMDMDWDMDVDMDWDQDWDQDVTPGSDAGVPPGVLEIKDNATCATAGAVPADTQRVLSYAAEATQDALCEASGGSAFFKLTLDHKEVVYIDAFASSQGTSLALYKDDCSAAPVKCGAESCYNSSGMVAGELEPGAYIIEARTVAEQTANTIRLNVQRTGTLAYKHVLSKPGTYSGNTALSTISAPLCGSDFDGDFGDFQDDFFMDEVMPADPATDFGADLVGAVPPDMGDAGGGMMDGGTPSMSDGGTPTMSDAGSELTLQDVYVYAGCRISPILSTCGRSDYPSALSVYGQRFDDTPEACSTDWNTCSADPNGFTQNSYMEESGLWYVGVGGQKAGDVGEYRLYFSY